MDGFLGYIACARLRFFPFYFFQSDRGPLKGPHQLIETTLLDVKVVDFLAILVVDLPCSKGWYLFDACIVFGYFILHSADVCFL